MEEIDLKDFFNYIKSKIIFIVILIIMFLAFVIIYDKNIKTPMYKTYTTLVLTQSEQKNSSNSTITQNDILLNKNLVSTYSEIIKSELILEQVIENLGIEVTTSELSRNISVAALNDTEILKISVLNADPKTAASLANEIADVFTTEIKKIYKIDNVSTIDKAKVPNQVANNTFKRDIVLAIFLGIFAGIGIIFVLYYFDDTIKSNENIEEKIGLPVLSKIFKSDVKTSKNDKNKTELVLSKYPKSLVSESIKTLRTNLQFSSVDEEIKTILITSSMPGEGKSFISSNLAIAFAQAKKRVLLIDCDMRKGRQHLLFKISNSRGLSNLLISKVKPDEISSYINETSIKNLDLITRGACPPNPSELLGSKKNKQIIEILKKEYDIIIFDGAPCNGIADSLIMSSLIDKVIIVSAESVTPKEIIENTKNSLDKVDASIAGIVINKVDRKNVKYYGYYGVND